MTSPQTDDKKNNTLNEIRRQFDTGDSEEALSQLNTYLDENPDDDEARLLKVEFCLELRRDYPYVVDTLKAMQGKSRNSTRLSRRITDLNAKRRSLVEENVSVGRERLNRFNDDALFLLEQALVLEQDDPSVPFAVALTLDKWIDEKRDEPPAPTFSFFATPEWRKRAFIQRAEKLQERCLKESRDRSQPTEAIHQKATQALLQYWLEQSEVHPELLVLLENPAYSVEDAANSGAMTEMTRQALIKVVENAGDVTARLLRNDEKALAQKLLAICKPYARSIPLIHLLLAERVRIAAGETPNSDAVSAALGFYKAALKISPLRLKPKAALAAARKVTRMVSSIRITCRYCFRELTTPQPQCICNNDLTVHKLTSDRYSIELSQVIALAHAGMAELLKDTDSSVIIEHVQAAREALGKEHRAAPQLETLLETVEKVVSDAESPVQKIARAIEDGITPSLIHHIGRVSDQKPDAWRDLPLKTRVTICRRLLDTGALKTAQIMLNAAFSDQPNRPAVKGLRAELNRVVQSASENAMRDAQKSLDMGDAETAVQIISTVMELNPSIELMLLRGKARMIAGHDSPALEDLYHVLSAAEDAAIKQEAHKGIAALLEKRWDLGGAQNVLNDALPDADVQAALARVERRKRGEPFILVESTNTRVIEDSLTREKVEAYHYATFAVAVREVGRPNLPYQFWTEKLLASNFEFVQVLGAFRDLLVDVTFGLRILCVPHPQIAERGQIKIALLARVANRDAEEARAQALALWNDVRVALPLTQDGVYIFDPVADEDELCGYLDPFEIDHAAEIVRRESRPELDGVYTIAPFVPGSLDIHNLMWVLLRQSKPAMISLQLKPTQLFVWERDAALFSEAMYSNNGKLAFNPATGVGMDGDEEFVSPEGYTMPGMVSRLSQMNQMEKTRIHFHRMNYLRSAYILRINVAGQAGTSQLLPEMVAAALLAPQRDNGETGGYEVTRALRGQELEIAKRNLRHVDVEQWGHSSSPDKTRRLRYLVSEVEAAHLFRLPMPMIAGVPGMRSLDGKPVSPPVGMPDSGTVLGVSTARTGTGTPSLIRQSRDDRRRHSYIVGKTGMGKSTLIASMALQDIDAGYGVFLLDPHGDLVEDVLMRIPKHRADDVIMIDPSDEERPVGLNILNPETEADRHRITNDFIGMLIRMYDPYNQGIVGPIFQQFVRNAMLAAMYIEGGTLIDVYRLLSDSNYARKIIPKITDPILKNFWEDIASRTENASAQWRAELLPYLLSKFSRFVEDSILRRMLGQPRSSVPWRQVMDEGKIVLVNLAKGKIGSETSQFLGLLILGDLLQAAFQRSKLPPARRRDYYIYIDEVQNYSTPLLGTMISEGRKFGVSLVLANQFLHQLDHGIREAVFGNVGSLISFRVGIQDAPALAPEFAPAFTAEDLIELGQFTASSKLLVNGVGARAFTMRTLLPSQVPNPVLGEEIRQASRMRYGTDIAQIEREIKAQF